MGNRPRKADGRRVFSAEFKRSIVGAYHQISAKHMDKYLDEQALRFDNRRNPYLFRNTLLKLLQAKTMPFKSLVRGS